MVSQSMHHHHHQMMDFSIRHLLSAPLGKICTHATAAIQIINTAHSTIYTRVYTSTHMCIWMHIQCTEWRQKRKKWASAHKYAHTFKNQSIKFHLMHPKTIANNSHCDAIPLHSIGIGSNCYTPRCANDDFIQCHSCQRI